MNVQKIEIVINQLERVHTDMNDCANRFILKDAIYELQEQVKLFSIPDVSKSFAVGAEVEITDCIKGHEFKIGEKVTIVEYDDNMWICRNKEGIEWYINEEEANVC